MEKNYKLHHIEIHPAKNGGHTVHHHFESRPVARRGAMSGGMYMERPEREEHVFGADEQHKMLTHVAKALGLKAAAKEEAAEGRERGKGKAEGDDY